ncbi:MAG: hypothetical protein KKA81_00775 [Bacteroidetes bacterium]|nr:hypothetical protein [Bacteroidota bacterium]
MRYIHGISGSSDTQEVFSVKERYRDISFTDRIRFESLFNSILVNGGPVREEELMGLSAIPDKDIHENRRFSIPLMIPNSGKPKGLILLLHGLNEKSWNKYWSWGRILSESTGNAVVFFPLSFHMDRVPSTWSDRRAMSKLIKFRNREGRENSSVSFANVAISERLENVPERFVLSGYQSIMDMLNFIRGIRSGKSDFSCDIPINIFGYSIGAFLSQVIALANPGGLFDDTKFFLFCGGSVFSRIRGASKYIIDEAAFNRLLEFYRDPGTMSISRIETFHEVMESPAIGNAFKTMLYPGELEASRIARFEDLRDQLKVVALMNDKVFPYQDIIHSISGEKGMEENIEILDYPYDYRHENPFPEKEMMNSTAASACFDHVFSIASGHFTGQK